MPDELPVKSAIALIAVGVIGWWLIASTSNPVVAVIAATAILFGVTAALCLTLTLPLSLFFAARERLTGKLPPLWF